MTHLLILGAGGHAKVVAETAIASEYASSIEFLDDRFDGSDQVALGNASIRLRWIERLQEAGYHLPVLIHPSSWVSSSAQIGSGSVIFSHATVQAEVLLGTGCILNSGCSVDHDAQLSDGVHVCPGARLAGEVQVGQRSWIGIGASVIQQVRIGSDVTIGAGAAVVSDIPDGITAIGVPACAVSSN
jgi:sugar O-acyltransferase (sialic acid O-acetyltransferase NeuD family)